MCFNRIFRQTKCSAIGYKSIELQLFRQQNENVSDLESIKQICLILSVTKMNEQD